MMMLVLLPLIYAHIDFSAWGRLIVGVPIVSVLIKNSGSIGSSNSRGGSSDNNSSSGGGV